MLLFDIDGTLLLTGGAGRIAFEEVMEELFQAPNSWGELVPDGKTDPIIMEELAQKNIGRSLSATEHKVIKNRYHEIFAREINQSERFRLLPGVPELLAALDNQEALLLGIATGNFELAARLKLRRGGIDQFFPFGGFGSDADDRITLTRIAFERGKARMNQRFDPSDVFVIGDTLYDIEAGKALGAKTIAVATGRTEESELATANPTHLFPDLTDTSSFLRIVS